MIILIKNELLFFFVSDAKFLEKWIENKNEIHSDKK